MKDSTSKVLIENDRFLFAIKVQSKMEAVSKEFCKRIGVSTASLIFPTTELNERFNHKAINCNDCEAREFRYFSVGMVPNGLHRSQKATVQAIKENFDCTDSVMTILLG
jgi:hypothetical protein